jgi:prepilin-type N-terminal cleavage/methylation domain-containing protein
MVPLGRGVPPDTVTTVAPPANLTSSRALSVTDWLRPLILPPCASARGKDQRGFTLLEVMIALLIAGLALAAVFRAAAESSHATSTAARYQEAISRARSHLDGTAVHLIAGEQDGDDGAGFHWHTLVRPADSTGKRDASGKPVASDDALVVTLYTVTVWITWREGGNSQAVRLDSERLQTTTPVGHR